MTGILPEKKKPVQRKTGLRINRLTVCRYLKITSATGTPATFFPTRLYPIQDHLRENASLCTHIHVDRHGVYGVGQPSLLRCRRFQEGSSDIQTHIGGVDFQLAVFSNCSRVSL